MQREVGVRGGLLLQEVDPEVTGTLMRRQLEDTGMLPRMRSRASRILPSKPRGREHMEQFMETPAVRPARSGAVVPPCPIFGHQHDW